MPRSGAPCFGFRLLSLVVGLMLLTSTSLAGTHALVGDFGLLIRTYLRHHGQYTQVPTKPFLGAHPGRDPLGRGGMWKTRTVRAAKALEEAYEAPLAEAHGPYAGAAAETVVMGGGQHGGLHSLSVEPSPGKPLPWEGRAATSSGGLNTGNGDKLTEIPLVSWKTRGGMTVDFTLYHNSETTYEDELGKGWTWSGDIYINNLGSSPTVHWGDGLAVPFSQPGGGGGTGGNGGSLAPETHGPSAPEFLPTTYVPPAGIYDQLVENADSSWTLTKTDGTKYQFTAAGFCDAIQDRNGNQITFTLNSSNYCTRITDSTGRYLAISLSGSNKFQSVTDPSGHVWNFTLNGSDCLTTITWPTLGTSSYTDGFTYDSSGRILTHTDRASNVWTNTYNSSDSSLASETDPLSHTTSYSYSSSATTITDPLSHTRVDNYSSGALASTVDESSFSESYTSRDANYNVLTLVDKRGNSWHYTYDSYGNVLTQTDPLSQEKIWTYNGFAEPLTSEDALSNTTTNTYDSHGNLLTVVDPLSHTVQTNTYDSYGELSSSSDALGHTTYYGYDSNGNLTSVTDPLSNVTSFGFDGMSRITSTTDPLSHTESIALDAWERPVTYTHPDSTTVTKTYLPTDQTSAVEDENSHTTSYAFDAAGRLTSVTNPKSEVESYGYDAADRRTTVTNGRGYVSTYTFTNRGEVATLTMPDGAVESWSYDGVGNTTAYENALSQTIDYVFDNANREAAIDYPAGTNTGFSYDNADRRTGMTDATGTTSWGYDNASRLTSLNTPEGNLTYAYDNAGRRTSMTDSSGTTSYYYDNANRRTSLTNSFSETTSWSFDAASRVTQQTFSGGQYDTFGYDSRNRMTSLSHYTSGASLISGETYAYDNASNMSSKTIDSVTTTYGYDNADQLTSESRSGYSASYAYDANGNRTSQVLNGTTYSYSVDNGDKLNSITSGGTTVKSYGYDGAGRTTSVTTSAGTTSLSYDYEDRVTGITYPSSATNSFTYNGLDTRVSKVDSTGSFTYRRDGADVTDPVLSDGVAAYTPGVSQHRSSTTTYDLDDFLGSATRQTSTSASTTATRGYDAFGNLLSSSGTPLGPFGFVGATGYQEDGDSGLKLLGHRYYDPSTGRFLSRDAAEDGRNWFSYCCNKAINAVDGSGLEWYYSIRTGVLQEVDNSGTGDNNQTYKGGFSGKKGIWRNNEDMTGAINAGPPPQGGYTIGPPRNYKSNGQPLPYNLPLTPDPGTPMHGRSGILIHGGRVDGDPSNGCIILPLPVRKIIWNSKDHHITVT